MKLLRIAMLLIVLSGIIPLGMSSPPALAQPDPPVTVQYLGHASFLITAPDGTRVITDPFNVIPDPITGGTRPFPSIPAEVVTISQRHPDHRNSGAVAGDPAIISQLTVVDQPTVQFGDVTITGYHTWAGFSRGINDVFVYQIGDVKLVHLGETGPIDDQATLDAISNADVIFVPVHVRDVENTIPPLLDTITPRTVVPMHYSTNPDNRFLGSPTADEFLAIMPPDEPVMRGIQELTVSPGMPHQIVVMDHTLYDTPPAQTATVQPVMMRYLGHSSFLITSPGGTRLLTDPFNTVPDAQGGSSPFPAGIAADVITISQNHNDHNNTQVVEGDPQIVTGPSIAADKQVIVGDISITGYTTQIAPFSAGFNTAFVYQIGDVKIVNLGETGQITDLNTLAALSGGDVVLVQMNSFPADEIMPLMETITAHTVIPMHFSLDPDHHYLESLSIEEFLAAVPADTVIVTAGDEIEITPDMPVQIVTMTRAE